MGRTGNAGPLRRGAHGVTSAGSTALPLVTDRSARPRADAPKVSPTPSPDVLAMGLRFFQSLGKGIKHSNRTGCLEAASPCGLHSLAGIQSLVIGGEAARSSSGNSASMFRYRPANWPAFFAPYSANSRALSNCPVLAYDTTNA
jgi:hypothetical protein